MNESEAGDDLALIETPCIPYLNDAVLILISRNLPNKRSEVSIITRSLTASLSFKDQVTKHTTVKRSIARKLLAILDKNIELWVTGLTILGFQ